MRMKSIVCQKENNVYTLSASTAIIEEVGAVEVYGIQIRGEGRQAEVKDISEDYSYVKKLFDLMVEETLYPEHLLDVVEDYLSGAFSTMPCRGQEVQTYTA